MGNNNSNPKTKRIIDMQGKSLATFGAGCFWCIHACLTKMGGVASVTSAYAAGNTKNPTYQDICTGKTNHAEVVQVAFDESKISYGELLKAFFKVHDPTTLNRQGNDVGTQYRSIILYHNDQQKELAQKMIDELNEKVYKGGVVTQLEAYNEDNYYPAEEYHQDYFEKNPGQGYCNAVVGPKVRKFMREFKLE